MIVEKRKGARSIKDIRTNILAQLNNGEIETVNLMEWLAIDQKKLLLNVFVQLYRKKYYNRIITAIENLQKITVNTINETIGAVLFAEANSNKDKTLFTILATHTSDTVRC